MASNAPVCFWCGKEQALPGKFFGPKCTKTLKNLNSNATHLINRAKGKEEAEKKPQKKKKRGKF